jgi:hypothetical protein
LLKLIVTEKGAGVNTMDSNIITDLSKLEITADGDLVLKALSLPAMPLFLPYEIKFRFSRLLGFKC